jgi:NTE family protein
LINLTHKKTFLKTTELSRFGFGDNIRYNLDYYIEQGFNLSFFKSQFNQFNRNVAKEISSLDLGSLGINSINVDFQDNQVFSILVCQ